MNSIYEEKFKVMSYDIDETGRASLTSICNYFQEIGFNHAGLLTNNGQLFENRNIGYFLTRLHVKMQEYPAWGQQIRIRTWLSPVIDRYAVRNFEIFGSEDNLIGCGENSAVFFDMLKKQAVVPDEDFRKKIPSSERQRPINDSFRNLPVFDSAQYETAFNVKYCDHDTYRHVNNVKYIDWALNSVPVNIWKEFQPSSIEINYRSESSHNDEILSGVSEGAVENDKLSFLHCLDNRTNGKVTAVLRTGWEKRII